MSKPRIVVEVKGGLVESVTCSVPANVLLVDLDVLEYTDEEEWLGSLGWDTTEDETRLSDNALNAIKFVGDPNE